MKRVVEIVQKFVYSIVVRIVYVHFLSHEAI